MKACCIFAQAFFVVFEKLQNLVILLMQVRDKQRKRKTT